MPPKFGTDVRKGRRERAGQTADNPTPAALLASGPQTSLDGERRWQSNGDQFWNANLTLDTIPPGLYRPLSTPDKGLVLDRTRIDTDNLLELPDSPSQQVIQEIKEFWTLEAAFTARGFIHKRGVLLWGPPGSGKTVTLQQLISVVVNQYQGIGLFIDHPTLAAQGLQMLRRIEPARPVVALLEDLDALVENHGENDFLALLDGEAQVSNIVFVGTTNYPERLDARFVDRPSRFDLVKYIDMPTAAARQIYLQTKEPSLTDDELEEWVERSDGFSIAHLRELIILCRCYNKTLDHAIARLNEMREDRPKSDNLGVVGFTPRKARAE